MESRTFIAVPPGATIKEQLRDRGMTQKEFSVRMDMSQKHVSRLINGEVQLTPDTAYKLELVLGVPASFWSNLEAHYRDQLAKVSAENQMEEDIELSKSFPYREMMKLGWVPETRRAVERVTYLRQFFEVVNLGLVGEGLVPCVAYRRKANDSNTALWAWAQKARVEARETEVGPINIARLEKTLPEIRSMTTRNPSEFCPELARLLSECGVALVLLPALPGMGVRGASFYDGRKIVCAMTVGAKDAGKFWLNLLHELGHIACGHLSTSQGTTEEQEREADEFARGWLMSPDDNE
jgi:HTH-type transcriptional regulator/antitoxin HigA